MMNPENFEEIVDDVIEQEFQVNENTVLDVSNMFGTVSISERLTRKAFKSGYRESRC